MAGPNGTTGSRPQPILAAILSKETLTAALILFFLVSRDLGFSIPQDTQLQAILAFTLIGGAIAAKLAANRSTPTSSPVLEEGAPVNGGQAIVAPLGSVKPTEVAALQAQYDSSQSNA